MLPPRSVPPAAYPTETVMASVSLAPGSPLSVTVTAKVHGCPLVAQVPENVAVVPAIANEAMVALWRVTLLPLSLYSS